MANDERAAVELRASLLAKGEVEKARLSKKTEERKGKEKVPDDEVN